MVWRLLPLLTCIYLPFIGGGLLTDDFAHVVRLSSIDSAASLIDQPDAFGFYRPITQASLTLAPGVRGERPAIGRAVNVALHAVVIAMAYVVARLTLPSLVAAGVATLAFALTPKAPPIAALWISARAELLMALFSLAAIAAWIVWTRKRGAWWLAWAFAAYALALLSKETATLLPLLLLVTPRPERPVATRVAAVAGFIALAALMYVWRSQTGALTPFAGDEHYRPAISLALWLRNAINYAGRMITAPLALVILLGLTRVSSFRRAEALASTDTRISAPAFAVAFVVAFLAPVLPIPLRSELYVYLPVLGVCLFVGWLSALLFRSIERRSLVAIAAYVAMLAAYQIARARDIHQDLLFSEQLVTALRRNTQIAATQKAVLLIPSDAATERSLQNTIGGYLYLVFEHAFSSAPRAAAVQYRGDPPHQADLRLICAYRQNDQSVVISPAP